MVVGNYPDLMGKRVLITGASAGIGKAAALAFDAQGAEVTIVARRRPRLEAVASSMQKAHVVVADLSSTEACEGAVAEAVEAMGGLDILVNNGAPGDTDDMYEGPTPKIFDHQLRLHVTNVFATCQAAKQQLLKNRGVVVNVSSVASQTPSFAPFMIPYTCAKAAQDMLTKSLARLWAADGIRVNAVLPGTVETEVADRYGAKMGLPDREAFAAAGSTMHALGRIASAEEMASAIVFMASNAASFMTGACVPVDGGWMLMGATPPAKVDDT